MGDGRECFACTGKISCMECGRLPGTILTYSSPPHLSLSSYPTQHGRTQLAGRGWLACSIANMTEMHAALAPRPCTYVPPYVLRPTPWWLFRCRRRRRYHHRHHHRHNRDCALHIYILCMSGYEDRFSPLAGHVGKMKGQFGVGLERGRGWVRCGREREHAELREMVGGEGESCLRGVCALFWGGVVRSCG